MSNLGPCRPLRADAAAGRHEPARDRRSVRGAVPLSVGARAGAQDSSVASETATTFLNLLLAAHAQQQHPIYVVLTMRSDFLGDCSQFSGLPEAINEGQYLVPRMTRDERRAAIVGPVGVVGAEISPVLLTRLVNDIGDNPDQLSILQHALNRTWARWQNEGGEAGALRSTPTRRSARWRMRWIATPRRRITNSTRTESASCATKCSRR